MARPRAVEVPPKQSDLTESIAVSIFCTGAHSWVCRTHLLLGDQVISTEETVPDVRQAAISYALRTLNAEAR
jgi:hypothetical protein